MKSLIKCPIDFSDRLLFFYYYYSKKDLIYIEKKDKKVLKKGQEYWIPEDYRIVEDNLIQYRANLFRKETPKWISADKMEEGLSRFTIIVNDIYSINIQSLDKSKVEQLNIPPKHLEYKLTENIEVPKELKRKSEMLYRLYCYWTTRYDTLSWENNSEIWVYEFSLSRKNPENYKNFSDVYWYEKMT